jgi:murein DD-endopeptidase MepM/ murein hydrolase activator NlpD
MRLIASLIAAIIIVTYPLSSAGKKLYSFRDGNGRLVYTDKAPSSDVPATVQQVDVEPSIRVRMDKTGSGNADLYSFYNEFYGPVEVEVKFVENQNVFSFPRLPQRFVIDPGKSKALLQIDVFPSARSWKYKLAYSYAPGRPMDTAPPQSAYFPPIAPNQSFEVSQGFNGAFSHTEKASQYAVDLSMPEGSPVFAARDGIVMSVDNDFYKNGTDKELLSRANGIRIVHDDGSMAFYGHLALEKAQVYPGLKVKAGDLIGYSGNTGFSTGPHLHFVVQYNSGMALKSIPFTFLNENGKAEQPSMGQTIHGVSATHKP